MKLLSKKTVQVDLAQQRKQQIDEGIALARKVDALRQTISELEAQHTAYINGIQKELANKSKFLFDEIANRESVLIELEARRIKLIEPLDIRELDIKTKESDIEQKRIVIEKGLGKIQIDTQKMINKYEESKKTLARINARERELVKVHESIIQKEKDIEALKQDTILEKEKFDMYMDIKNKELLTREANIATNERALELSTDLLHEDQSTLEKNKIRVEDEWKQLERELKRQHGN